jgi:xylulokinase
LKVTSDRLFIGIDSGTQGTKAVLFSEARGEIISQSYAEYDLIENEQGGREQDPLVWITACEKVIKAVLKDSLGLFSSIKGIGVSGQQHGMVALDETGNVIRPVKLWCDTQTSDQCRKITERLGGEARIVQETGNRMAEGFTAPKVLWMKDNEPKNYERLAKLLLPHDYINYWLTGEKKSECGDASGTAYFDVVNRKWSKPVLDAIDDSGKLSACLPDLILSQEPCGVLKKDIAALLGFSHDVLVSSGGGDNMMAAIGTGNIEPGVVTASLGTSGTIYAYSDQPVVDHTGELASFCSSTGGWLPLICTMNVTVATELVRNLFNFSIEEMNHQAQMAVTGSQGIILLPYFNGERTPPLPNGTGSYLGLNSINFTPPNICLSAMEGPAMGLRYGINIMKKYGISPKEVRLTGGGAKSALWRQIAADIFNCPVVSPFAGEAGALGAALQSMWCWYNEKKDKTSIKAVTDRFVKLDPGTRCEPDEKNVKVYNKIFDRYTSLNDALTPFFQ